MNKAMNKAMNKFRNKAIFFIPSFLLYLIMSLYRIVYTHTHNELLGMAIYNNQPALVMNLIRQGAFVNSRYEGNKTPLHYACQCGYAHIAHILINAQANVNAQCYFGFTPLHEAAEQGNNTLIKLLIRNHALVNSNNIDEETPLHYAARRGHTTAVLTLLNADADVNAEDKIGFIPLEESEGNTEKNLETIIVLLSYGSVIDNNKGHYLSRTINQLDHELEELPASSSIIDSINKYTEIINSSQLKDILIKRLLSQQKYLLAFKMLKEFPELKNTLSDDIYFAQFIKKMKELMMPLSLQQKYKHNQFSDIDIFTLN